MIIGRYLLTAFGLDLKFSENIIHGGEGLYKVFLVPMVDVDNNHFNILRVKIVKPEESFIDMYVSE